MPFTLNTGLVLHSLKNCYRKFKHYEIGRHRAKSHEICLKILPVELSLLIKVSRSQNFQESFPEML